MFAKALVSVVLLSSLAAAAPHSRREVKTAATLIKAVMPTSDSCSGAQFPDECRTADQASQYIIDAMAKYKLYTYGEIAAVLSLIGYESVDMKFKHNVSPGRAGQGTSNMQMSSLNIEYAKSITELATEAATADENSILALVTPDQYNFGSGPWFLTEKCSDTQAELKKGTDAGWEAYMTCVGVDATDSERLAYWTRAKEAFGLSG
ncbi:hypothetical protein NKR23_g148 [Pleurostoma richardsiae]|uniref:Uncharacterized protein n=1 Tax=Pleurostoma richardsiae TaxID=41990 RepID=A0AA38VQR6_9PEZI|nr:hypothetical protein NKR23_g148 [Pleurostoma richardsiae]